MNTCVDLTDMANIVAAVDAYTRPAPPRASRLDTCRHMYGNFPFFFFSFFPPFAPSDSAYSRAVCGCWAPSWQPLWGSPNIAMAYVHMKCGEWRRLEHHVALFSLFLAASQNKSFSKNRVAEHGNDTAARSIDIFRIYVVFSLTVLAQR